MDTQPKLSCLVHCQRLASLGDIGEYHRRDSGDDTTQEAYLGLERISTRRRDRLQISLLYGTPFHVQQCAEKYLRDHRGDPYHGASTFE